MKSAFVIASPNHQFQERLNLTGYMDLVGLAPASRGQVTSRPQSVKPTAVQTRGLPWT